MCLVPGLVKERGDKDQYRAHLEDTLVESVEMRTLITSYRRGPDAVERSPHARIARTACTHTPRALYTCTMHAHTHTHARKHTRYKKLHKQYNKENHELKM